LGFPGYVFVLELPQIRLKEVFAVLCQTYQKPLRISINQHQHKRPLGLILHQRFFFRFALCYLSLHRPRRVCNLSLQCPSDILFGVEVEFGLFEAFFCFLESF
jgi:hypothetical protein